MPGLTAYNRQGLTSYFKSDKFAQDFLRKQLKYSEKVKEYKDRTSGTNFTQKTSEQRKKEERDFDNDKFTVILEDLNVYDQAKEIASKKGEQDFNKFLKVLIASFQVGYHPDKTGDKLESLSPEKTTEKKTLQKQS
jgi:hypothetical protein